MNVLISGSNGFVGKNLSQYLDQDSALLNLASFERSLLESHQIDIQNFMYERNANVVIHLAGIAHDFKGNINLTQYSRVNTDLTIKLFDAFVLSQAEVFIFLSSAKSVTDISSSLLTEETICNPQTDYGKSKLAAEEYILSKELSKNKRIYILRPCMIHGPENKGNLNLLFKIVSKSIPWPLGAFENKRSFCSIDNLMFIFKELIEREDIPSGIYNVADDEPLSTNELIGLIAQSQYRSPKIWSISRSLIDKVARIGDKLNLPLNTERLQKLTSSYVVSNAKIKAAIGKPLPVSSREGLLKTFKSFNSK